MVSRVSTAGPKMVEEGGAAAAAVVALAAAAAAAVLLNRNVEKIQVLM